MVDFTNVQEAQQWLENQPREIAITIAARRALRVLPLIVVYQGQRPGRNFFVSKALPCFRASAAAWVAANFPAPDTQLREAVERAAQAANVAYFRASDDTDGALAAADQAAERAARESYHFESSRSRSSNLYSPYSATAYADGYLAVASAVVTDSKIFGGKAGDERTRLALALAGAPLWPRTIPNPFRLLWPRLKLTLLAANEDWDVWTDWYEARLTGQPPNADLEIARVLLPDALWDDGPRVVNAAIRRLIDEAGARQDVPTDPIPAQGAGPHFTLGASGLIALAPPSEIDAEDNNVARIRQLLPLTRRAADDLSEHLNPNQFRELARDVADYRAAIADDAPIPWGTVFGLGVMLENAATAAERILDDPMWPRLEDTAKSALDSLLTLHGPLILATAEGRELADEADRMRLTREEQAAMRADAESVAARLQNAADVIEPAAAKIVETAAEIIGEGLHPERGTVFGMATIRNVSVVVVSAGTLAALVPGGALLGGFIGAAAAAGVAWVGYESLKKSKAFSSATNALGTEFDRLSDQAEAQVVQRLVALAPFRQFVRANEDPLRRIATTTSQLRWMLPYIDFIVRSGEAKEQDSEPE